MTKPKPSKSSKKAKMRSWDKYFGLKLILIFYGTLIASFLPAAVCVVTILLSIPGESFIFLVGIALVAVVSTVLLFHFYVTGKRVLSYLFPQVVRSQPLLSEGGKALILQLEAFDVRTAITVLGKLDLVNSKLQHIFSSTQLLFTIMILELGAVIYSPSPVTAGLASPYLLLIPGLALPFPIIGIVISSLRMKPQVMLSGYLSTLKFYEDLAWTKEEASKLSRLPNVRQMELKRKRDALRGARNYYELLLRREVPSFHQVDLDDVFCNFALALDIGGKTERNRVKDFIVTARNHLMYDIVMGTHEGFKKSLDGLVKTNRGLASLSNLREQLKPSLGEPRKEINLRATVLKLVFWLASTIAGGMILKFMIP